MHSHFPKLWQNTANVFIGVDEGNYDGQVASGFDEVSSVKFASSEKAGYGVEGYSSENIFFAQVFSRCSGRWCKASPSVR
jgi:hypothetical protein